jgi:hypothetical protein
LTTKENEHSFVFAPISFSIPLHGEEAVTGTPVIGESKVHFFARGQTATAGEGCGTGSATRPEAEPGNLCIYTGEGESLKAEQVEILPAALPRLRGASATGASLQVAVHEAGEYAIGTWAVTAP